LEFAHAPRAAGAETAYRHARAEHWDAVARRPDSLPDWGAYYRRRLIQVYRYLVPPAQRVLDIGCAQGDLLAAVRPRVGVGVDLSDSMVETATTRYPTLRFIQADVHELELDETFDVILLSDVVNDLWDVQTVFQRLARVSTPRTRIIINSYSQVWQAPLALGRRLGLARPVLAQNWLTADDIASLLRLADMEVIRRWEETLLPLPIPLLAPFANRYLAKIWPFKLAALTHFFMARPLPHGQPRQEEPRVSVIVPARNEAGNVPRVFEETPEMGRGTELVFVEGHSTDGTYEAIEQSIAAHPERRARLFKQEGRGKGDAVRLGFTEASGDALMILDADLTVSPDDLPRFYDALHSGKGEFVNGVRLVYPMEEQAMRFFNLLGNKFFSLAFSWLLGQPIKDTLCGTKVLWKSDYDLIAANRAYFGDFDPFGDFDLLFGAAKLNLKIIDLPIRYRERTYGTTNIQRWKHGLLLLRMVVFAARRIKFI
jgi:ubiquinone/menaquinone biosynthesis C-methylase UbiE